MNHDHLTNLEFWASHQQNSCADVCAHPSHARDRVTMDDQIEYLFSCGYSPEGIAECLGISVEYVNEAYLRLFP